MEQQKHIVNRQILEVKLPKTVDTFAMQQELCALSKEQLTPIIDRVLSELFHENAGQDVQLDRVVVDLGKLKLDDFVSVFTEKFEELVSETRQSHLARTESGGHLHETRSEVNSKDVSGHDVEHVEGKADSVREFEGAIPSSQTTPLRLIAHYLTTGILPWWTSQTTKTYLKEQLTLLLNAPSASFSKMISQLPLKSVYLERFLNTFSEDQILKSLQLLTNIDLRNLPKIKKELYTQIEKSKGKAGLTTNDRDVSAIFWKSVFQHVNEFNRLDALKNACLEQSLSELGIDEHGAPIENKQLELIQSIVKKYSKVYLNDSIWQQFFKRVMKLVQSPAFNRVGAKMLTECKRLLVVIELTRENSDQEITTDLILRPLADHLQLMQQSVTSTEQNREPLVIEQLSSDFEETDFITIENAGLVLFWPFLTRFFQNLSLTEDADFRDEVARNKAICALQYLCGEEENDLFEGSLSLNKLLCGADLEDTVVPVSLSSAEKEMIEDLLQVVIQRGPHWGNLSVAGLRSSYLLRQGSLRMREGHWFLQVEKQTHDITMERLPWSISTVKLPWMDKIILVEWM